MVVSRPSSKLKLNLAPVLVWQTSGFRFDFGPGTSGKSIHELRPKFVFATVTDTSRKNSYFVATKNRNNFSGRILNGLARQVASTRRRPLVRPRTKWRDYISGLFWSRLGVKSEKLSKVAENPEMFWSLQSC